MKKSGKRTAGIWALAGILGAIAYAQINGIERKHNSATRSETNRESYVSAERLKELPFREGPIYSDSQVPANMCSRYVRFAAKELFGLNYPSADAWDIRYALDINEIKIDSANTLEKLARDGKLKPGMMVGVYNPTSRYNSRAKEDGAGYTHVMLYLGQKDGELLFADKFGKSTRPKISLSEIRAKWLQPREIMFIEY